MNTVLTVDQKIELMSLALGDVDRYKQMVDVVCNYSPQEDPGDKGDQ
jgi:hypothetical protein